MAPFGWRQPDRVDAEHPALPGVARGALDVLGRWQAKERDDYRDAERARSCTRLRYGELAHFRLIPHTPY